MKFEKFPKSSFNVRLKCINWAKLQLLLHNSIELDFDALRYKYFVDNANTNISSTLKGNISHHMKWVSTLNSLGYSDCMRWKNGRIVENVQAYPWYYITLTYWLHASAWALAVVIHVRISLPNCALARCPRAAPAAVHRAHASSNNLPIFDKLKIGDARQTTKTSASVIGDLLQYRRFTSCSFLLLFYWNAADTMMVFFNLWFSFG